MERRAILVVLGLLLAALVMFLVRASIERAAPGGESATGEPRPPVLQPSTIETPLVTPSISAERAPAVPEPPAGAPVEPAGSGKPSASEAEIRGRFVLHLLVLPEQQSRITWYTAKNGERRIGGTLVLGRVEIPEGGVLEREFDLTENFPASVTVSVLVNGEPVSGLTVRLRPDDEESPTELEALTDRKGRAGPLRLYPGSWYLGVSDGKCWFHWEPAPIQAVPAAELSVTIPVDVVTGIITCVDAGSGQPLASREVWVSNAPVATERRSSYTWNSRTDEGGRLELRLCTGDYLFKLGSPSRPPPDMARANAVRLTWTREGPATPEVRL